jgi:RNA polymerase-binding transcription factor DksA
MSRRVTPGIPPSRPRSIQAALNRIEDGTYGICDNCGEDIGEARLAAVPEATRCVNCAD